MRTGEVRSQVPPRLARGPLAAILVLAIAAGCGGGDDGDGPPTTAESQAEGPCALLTADEVSDLFGEQAEVAPPIDDTAASSTCLWQASDDAPDTPTQYQLQLSIFVGDAALDPRSYGESSEPITGLGEQAFVTANGTLGTTAGYRDADQTVILTYAIVGGEDAPASADAADAVVDLLRSVEQRSAGI